MIHNEPVSLKKIVVWSLFFLWILIASYLALLASITLWVGFTFTREPGHWVPIVAGGLFLVGLGWTFIAVSKRLLRRTRDEKPFRI